MRRRTQIPDGNHSIEDYHEFEITIKGYCEPGYEPITHRAPEDCDPGCPSNIDDFRVLISAKDKPDLDVTGYLSKGDIERLKESLMSDYVDCFNCDNDMAYEMRAGK